ncbi:hypothetical protein [uncultured Tateyamaria sp.]|uniref:hypothetical protein n=1 Tax=uncultured Tateyamaria sp. TaxID=455651 RepID=UPI002616FDEE|nr:hypothetical protein [uncultured Tateyamaria sp.]
MPKSKKPNRTRGDTRTLPKTKRPSQPPARPGLADTPHLRTQIRGGRPPRFPGRTGGR